MRLPFDRLAEHTKSLPWYLPEGVDLQLELEVALAAIPLWEGRGKP